MYIIRFLKSEVFVFIERRTGGWFQKCKKALPQSRAIFPMGGDSVKIIYKNLGVYQDKKEGVRPKLKKGVYDYIFL